MAHYGKILIYFFFQRFFASTNKCSFWQGNWVQGHISMKFRHLSRSETRGATFIYHVYK